MTNTEAIKKLDQQKTLLCFDCMHPQTVEWCEEHCQVLEAYNMAINALQAQEQLAKSSPKVDSEFGELISNKRTQERTETHACDLISRKMVLALPRNKVRSLRTYEVDEETINVTDIEHLPSAQPDYQEVLGWLLAYHTKSFYLHGRYLPHEVISWLINDFTKGFIAERRSDG